MNDLIRKHAIKTAINLIGEDTITNAIAEMLKKAIEKKQESTLEEGEADIIAIAYEQNNSVFGAIATISANREIKRIIKPQNLETLAMQLIKSI